MDQVCKNPCAQCPFRKVSFAGWLGQWKNPQELHAFVMTEQPFPCHMTQANEPDEVDDPEKLRYCKGAILYMKKACKMPQFNKFLREEVLKLKMEDTEEILSVPDFIKHHTRKPYGEEIKDYEEIKG